MFILGSFQQSAEAWELDTSHMPKVGELVAMVGGLHVEFDQNIGNNIGEKQKY